MAENVTQVVKTGHKHNDGVNVLPTHALIRIKSDMACHASEIEKCNKH